MIKWAAFCRHASRQHDYFATDKLMAVATFAARLHGLEGRDGWARDGCRDRLQRCALKAWRCLAADARHDTFMFHGRV
jgi:hypothetical protein